MTTAYRSIAGMAKKVSKFKSVRSFGAKRRRIQKMIDFTKMIILLQAIKNYPTFKLWTMQISFWTELRHIDIDVIEQRMTFGEFHIHNLDVHLLLRRRTQIKLK